MDINTDGQMEDQNTVEEQHVSLQEFIHEESKFRLLVELLPIQITSIDPPKSKKDINRPLKVELIVQDPNGKTVAYDHVFENIMRFGTQCFMIPPILTMALNKLKDSKEPIPPSIFSEILANGKYVQYNVGAALVREWFPGCDFNPRILLILGDLLDTILNNNVQLTSIDFEGLVLNSTTN